MKPSPDTELVDRARSGDRDAFGELVTKYQRLVYHVIFRMTGNHPETDDLCQQVFLKAFEGLPQFKAGSDFKSWLYRISANTCIDHLRRPRTPPKEAGRKGESAPMDQTQKAVFAAIRTLPPDQRAVIVLHIIQGLPQQEVAKMVGCPLPTLRTRLFTARRSLESLLKEHL